MESSGSGPDTAWAMSEENVEIVPGVCSAWQRGDFEAALERPRGPRA